MLRLDGYINTMPKALRHLFITPLDTFSSLYQSWGDNISACFTFQVTCFEFTGFSEVVVCGERRKEANYRLGYRLMGADFKHSKHQYPNGIKLTDFIQAKGSKFPLLIPFYTCVVAPTELQRLAYIESKDGLNSLHKYFLALKRSQSSSVNYLFSKTFTLDLEGGN